MDRTPLAKKAVYEIGGNYQAIAVYDKAAEWYERYAEDRTAENADKALSDAVLLRLGLGTDADVQRAIEDGARFQRNYGATKGPQAAAIAFAIGAHYGEKEEWDKAESALRGALALVDRVAGIDVRIQAHALLGRAYANSKNAAAAKAEYARVGDLWRDPVAGKKKIDDTYAAEDDGQRTKRLAKVLNAVGEALFFAADQTKQAEVDPLRFPVYSGSGSTADVKRHIDTKVKEWLERKMAAITKVEREYAQIMAIQPVAPPRWVIAAGSRVGGLGSRASRALHRGPSRKERADQSGARKAGARRVPLLLRAVPTLRRQLTRLRDVARGELPIRVPPRRRAPRRPDSREHGHRSHTAARRGGRRRRALTDPRGHGGHFFFGHEAWAASQSRIEAYSLVQ